MDLYQIPLLKDSGNIMEEFEENIVTVRNMERLLWNNMFWTSYSHGTHELLAAGTTEQDL